MLTIYLCFLAGGVVLPFISFAMGFLSNGLDSDLNTDVDMNTDLDFHVDNGFEVDGNISTEVGTDVGTDIGSDVGDSFPVGHQVSLEAGSESFVTLGLLPTSLLSISALAITFGASGALMTYGKAGKFLTFLVSLLIGYFFSVVIQSILKSLKKVQKMNSGIDEKELLLYDGTVIDTILPGQMGTVRFTTLKDVSVSYPAICDDKDIKLVSGKIVKVKEFKNGVFIVEPKNKYE